MSEQDETLRIEIRKARLSDADAFVELAPMAFEPLVRVAFGPRAPQLLRALFKRTSNLSSYENTFVATVGGTPAAMLQGFDWTQYRAQWLYTYWLHLLQLRAYTAATLLAVARIPRWLGKPNEGEYYILYLATHPRFRGLGLGTRLLMRAEGTARKQGAHSLSLDADPDNGLAIPLYLKMGFTIEEDVPAMWLYRNMGRLCRMRRPLA